MSVAGMIMAETRVDTTRYIFGGYNTHTTSRSEQVLTSALGVAVFGVSAYVGNKRVNSCRSAFAELRERLNARQIPPPVPGN